MDAPLVYWTGSPAPAEPGGPTDVVQRRLHALPAGAYAVRLSDAAPAAQGQDFETFGLLLAATTPAVAEVIPVNASLIARSLRRMVELRRFPVVLPQLVEDVG